MTETTTAPSFSATHLKAILPNLVSPEENFKELEKALVEFNMTTFDRVAQFLGQVGGETEGGRYFEELYNDPPGKEAYFRSFLGDEWPYHGHGAIHLTHADAYDAASKYFEVDFLKDSDLVNTLKWRWRTACWFWSVYKDINTPADHANFNECMRLVLGTSQHASREKRWNYYVRACQNLPIPFAVNGRYWTRLDNALAYIWPLRANMPYGWWTSGPVPEGPPAYGKNEPPPEASSLVGKTVFCAGVPNLMLRRVGKRIPFRPSLPVPLRYEYDGGTWAYSEYFNGYKESFNAGKDYPHGTLVGIPFSNNGHQGHVGIVLGNAHVLQSYDAGGGHPGLNSMQWLAQAHAMVGFHYAVMPWNWINYLGDEAEWFEDQ